MKKIYVNSDAPIQLDYGITACIGYFDGLHKGHRALIQKVLHIAKQDHTIPAMISFEPDPWTIVRKVENPPHILSMKERARIIEVLGIELYIILEFDQKMADLSVQAFHEHILKALHVETLVCGFDFHYGSHGSGSIDTLQNQTFFQVEVIDKIEEHDEKISSSRIERLLTHGCMEEAKELLTRPFKMSGTIRKGNQIGRTYGFPTANLAMDDAYVCPKKGVYIGAVKVHGNKRTAIINVGNNPTFNYQRNISIEAYILNFNEDIYNEYCEFYFYSFLRDETKYPSKNELIEQLKKDEQAARTYFIKEKEILLCD